MTECPAAVTTHYSSSLMTANSESCFTGAIALGSLEAVAMTVREPYGMSCLDVPSVEVNTH